MNEQKNNQATNQGNQASFKEDAKTVVNGKVVSLNQAQQMQEQASTNQTGIQSHHDNSTEPVNAGEVAQNQNLVQSNQDGVASFMKQANAQSGQQYMGQMSEELQKTVAQQKQSEDHNVLQDAQAENTKGTPKAKANNKKVD